MAEVSFREIFRADFSRDLVVARAKVQESEVWFAHGWFNFVRWKASVHKAEGFVEVVADDEDVVNGFGD